LTTVLPSVVVLGGAGFVGRHLASVLVDAGYRVVVPTRRRAAARDLFLLPTVEVIEADIRDDATLARLTRGAAAVINLVGILNESRRQTFADVHVGMTERAIAACKAAGVSRFLQMSALNADPVGPSRYLATKGEAERRVEASGLAYTIFQPSVIFGREDDFLNKFAALLRMAPVMPLPGADVKFQPVYVGDVAQCFVHALADDATVGMKYRLCGPAIYTLRQLVRYVGEVTGNVRPVIGLGPTLAGAQACILEHMPGTPMSRDNLLSMQRDSVCGCPFPAEFDIVPAAIEALVPGWLAPGAEKSRYDRIRAQGGR
jgi:NADH dehydrogenase